jgi:hypothetical protein
MKKFILFIILVVISQLAFGQTPIPGGNVVAIGLLPIVHTKSTGI